MVWVFVVYCRGHVTHHFKFHFLRILSLLRSDSEGHENTLATEFEQENKTDAILQNLSIKQIVGFPDPATTQFTSSSSSVES